MSIASELDLPENDYTACYVFKPPALNGNLATPVKRRKTPKDSKAPSEPFENFHLPLFEGTERSQNVKTRSVLFDTAWGPQDDVFETMVRNANTHTIDQILSFVHETYSKDSDDLIPTGLITIDPTVTIYIKLLESITVRLSYETKVLVINLSTQQTPNLKAALKYINRCALNQAFGAEYEDNLNDRQQGNRTLNYDLQILYDCVRSQALSKVILSLQDGQAFEGAALNELISAIVSWSDRIPIVLLVGVATSLDIFQDKLSIATKHRIRAVQFDVVQIDTESVFKQVVSLDQPNKLWLGPSLSRTILQRQSSTIQDLSSFIRNLKYAYMTHLFTNPLSIFLADSASFSVQAQHFEAVRNLPSFRREAETLLEEGKYDQLRNLLDDNDFLLKAMVAAIENCKLRLSGILTGIETLCIIQSCLNARTTYTWSDLYVKGMSGELGESLLLEDMILSVRKQPSNSLEILLSRLQKISLLELEDIKQELGVLVSSSGDRTKALRSEHDAHLESIRTTIVAHKVELSKHSSSLSDKDLTYTRIINRLDTSLRDLFRECFVEPKSLFLHEIIVFDFRLPHRDVFTPKPRSVIERALTSPHDYLGCSCCGGAKDALSATQPTVAILYQLYLESGSLINTADLWSAFQAVLGKESAEEEDADREQALALFARALAELKYMGMIKGSRKKSDHIAKLLWQGL